MGKGRFCAKPIKKISLSSLGVGVGERVVLSIDVAKEKQVGVIWVEHAPEQHVLFSWQHPAETAEFFRLAEGLKSRGARVESVSEPTGTYGDPLVAGLRARGVDVFRVQGKQVHDLKEVYDRVPSLHDPKAAWLVLELHLKGASEPWEERTEAERDAAARVAEARYYQDRFLQTTNELEALLGKFWPELTQVVKLTSKTLLALLASFGGPSEVERQEAEARTLMRKTGCTFLREEKIDQVMAAARNTCGVRMTAAEVVWMKRLAEEALRYRAGRQQALSRLRKSSGPVPKTMVEVLGCFTAVVLVAGGLDPLRFIKPKAYEKALGLNLRERSSGRKQMRGIHITKRGNSYARQLLYLAVLRLVQGDPVVRAWYRKKVARDGGKAKHKALVAVMRKLARALWHVARGEKFDASRLFDTTRLREQLPVPPLEEELAVSA